MTELEKCMAGELYNCHDEIFLQYKKQAKELLDIYNRLTYDQKEEKKEILHKLFGGIGTNVSVGAPFLCDYGCNIITGSNVSINMNCSFIDCNKIKIGNNVMIASNVQIYTATHPVELAERLTSDWTVPFPVSWTVKMKKKQKETQDILSYHTQAAGCSDKARAKASGGRQPIEECGRTGL